MLTPQHRDRFHMGRPGELVDRRHGLEPVAAHIQESYDFLVQRPTLIVSYDALDPPTVSCWADDEEIALGESTTIRWSSSNATSCLFRRVGNPLGTFVDLSGSQSVTPSQTTTYRVSCSNDAGSAADEVTITVPEPARALLGLTALATLIGLRRRRRPHP